MLVQQALAVRDRAEQTGTKHSVFLLSNQCRSSCWAVVLVRETLLPSGYSTPPLPAEKARPKPDFFSCSDWEKLTGPATCLSFVQEVDIPEMAPWQPVWVHSLRPSLSDFSVLASFQ